jgi:hypothetical protein
MALWETFFEHEAPHLRYQSPKGDGAHQGQTDGVSGKCVMFLIGNMSLSHFGDAQRRGLACMRPRAVKFSECFPMKIELNRYN